MALVDFERPFTLNLEGGGTISFKAGPQQVDDGLMKHWFVASHVRGGPRRVAPGTQEYLAEDMAIAKQLQEEEQASQERQTMLRDMRTRAAREAVNDAIYRTGTQDEADLTPIQKELRNAARRQAENQRRAEMQAPPPGGESHNHDGQGPLREEAGFEPLSPDLLPGGESTRQATLQSLEVPEGASTGQEPAAGGESTTNPADGGPDGEEGTEDGPGGKIPKPKLAKPVLKPQE
jgi:hypothetical protein